MYCATVVESYCKRVGNADGEGRDNEDSLVHKSYEVNEYLVKAKNHSGAQGTFHKIFVPSKAFGFNPTYIDTYVYIYVCMYVYLCMYVYIYILEAYTHIELCVSLFLYIRVFFYD